MTLKEQFRIARDITPAWGSVTVEIEGRKVEYPVLGACEAMHICEGQGTHIDLDGTGWLIGTTSSGEIVKRRLP